jgi:hypothetical protein
MASKQVEIHKIYHGLIDLWWLQTLLFGLAKARLKLSQSRSLNLLSTTNTTHHHHPPPPPTTTTHHHHPPPPHKLLRPSRHNTKLSFGMKPRINPTKRKTKKKKGLPERLTPPSPPPPPPPPSAKLNQAEPKLSCAEYYFILCIHAKYSL